MVGSVADAPNPNWKKTFDAEFMEVMEIAKTLGNVLRITKEGTLVVIGIESVIGGLVSDVTSSLNKYENSTIKQQGGSVQFLSGKSTSRKFKTGEKAFVGLHSTKLGRRNENTQLPSGTGASLRAGIQLQELNRCSDRLDSRCG